MIQKDFNAFFSPKHIHQQGFVIVQATAGKIHEMKANCTKPINPYKAY